jgi:hypothetical protein
MFTSAAPDEWNVRCIRSPATESWTFMKSVFVDKQFHDTIYITANPHAYKIPPQTFYSTNNLVVSDWDDEIGTVHPSDVASRVRQTRREHPNKRIIAHFMQPHFPFLGSTAEELPDHGISQTDGRIGGDDETYHPWQQTRLWVDNSRIVKAYRENHSIIVEILEGLIKNLDERVAVTADHGNLIGERGPLVPMKMYGHPVNLHMRKLIEVPWVRFSGKEIEAVPEQPKEDPELDDEETAEARLKSLGYV